MTPRLQVVHEAPRTLADLELACAAARAQGFGGDAQVMPPTWLSGALVIVRPYDDEEVRPLPHVLSEVRVERGRQDAKWGEQNHPDGVGDDRRLLGDPDLPTYGTLAYRVREYVNALSAQGASLWAPILLEEVFEAVSSTSTDELRAELVQVAAVAVSWAQALDRRAAGGGGAGEGS